MSMPYVACVTLPPAVWSAFLPAILIWQMRCGMLPVSLRLSGET